MQWTNTSVILIIAIHSLCILLAATWSGELWDDFLTLFL